MRNNFQVPANVWKTRNGSAEQIEPAPDGNLTQKLPSGLSGALRMREHSRHRPPQKIVWSSDAASWQHAPNIISRASKIPCLSDALRMRKQPSNVRKRLKDISPTERLCIWRGIFPIPILSISKMKLTMRHHCQASWPSEAGWPPSVRPFREILRSSGYPSPSE